jgi:SRSO17 transposase
VPIEQMLELWCVELRQVKANLKSLFAHPSVGASAAAFLDGVLGRSHWDADALRDLVRDYALETLAAPGAVLVIDETGFLKQGARSCGVGHQYTGSAGKIANCQIGVFAAYVADKGCAFIDRQLYLPKDWANKPERRTAEQIAKALVPEAWTRLSAGDGTKGARLYEWAYVELADLEADDYNEHLTGLWTRGLLIRRSLSDGDLAFFSTWCRAGTLIEELVRVEGQRWAIEDAFETAKTELGLTHNETRSWHGWHRHGSLVMLAFAMMAVVRQRANSHPSPQKRSDAAKLQRWCDGLFRKSAAWPHASSNAGSSLPL